MVWKELQFHNLKLWDTNEILSFLCCHLILHHHHQVAFISIRKNYPFTPQIFTTLFQTFPKLPEEFTNHIPSTHSPPLLLTPCWSPWRNPASVQVRRTWWMNDPRHDASTWSRPGSWVTAIPVGPEAHHQWVVKSLHVLPGVNCPQVR